MVGAEQNTSVSYKEQLHESANVKMSKKFRENGKKKN